MKIYNGKVDCSPEEVNYDSQRINAVNDFFIRMIESKKIFGVSYRLARKGKVFAAAAIGSRHYNDANTEMLPETLFNTASQTKLFAAAAIFMLAEDGLLSVGDAVAKYFPQFDGAPYNEITLAHLLTHTSGLYAEWGTIPDKHHVDTYEHIKREYEKNGADFDWIAAGLRGGMRRKPGEEWQYCNFGMNVLGAIVEKISGEKYSNFVLEKICAPLEMKNTTHNPSPDAVKTALVFNSWTEEMMNKIQSGETEETMWDLMPRGSGGFFSTTNDMARFGMMLQNYGRLGDVRILGRKAVELMTTHHLQNVPDFCWGANEKDRKYGLGVDMRKFPGTLYSHGTFLHEGAGHSVLIVDPAEEMVCSCVYPWVNDEFNMDCNSRLYNVIWSGIV